jgi:hypothetical protein
VRRTTTAGRRLFKKIQKEKIMSITRAALALVGAALFIAAPAGAQTVASPVASPVSPCAGETTRTFAAPADRSAEGDPADWTQAQINANPRGEELRDSSAYNRQVTALYQQHLTIYTGQAQKFADDKQLLEQFKAGFQCAKLAVARDATANIAAGDEPVDPNNDIPTLIDPARQSAVNHSPVESGDRDLETLATNVSADRAAMTQSCEMLVQDRQILDRISNAR